jgi:hypothetical protein
MINDTILPAQMWMTAQEPRVASFVPNSYLLLLSALDNGWRIQKVELRPSWDQHGLVYLVSLYLYTSDHTQEILLPRTPLVESFLEEHFVQPVSPQVRL